MARLAHTHNETMRSNFHEAERFDLSKDEKDTSSSSKEEASKEEVVEVFQGTKASQEASQGESEMLYNNALEPKCPLTRE